MCTPAPAQARAAGPVNAIAPMQTHSLVHVYPAVAVALLCRNSFDTVLIPTQLVLDTCYATFVKLEGDKLGEEKTKTTWEGRLAMVASNRDADEGEQEAFVVSKYDLVPESLVDMVQVSWLCSANLAGKAAHVSGTTLVCELLVSNNGCYRENVSCVNVSWDFHVSCESPESINRTLSYHLQLCGLPIVVCF